MSEGLGSITGSFRTDHVTFRKLETGTLGQRKCLSASMGREPVPSPLTETPETSQSTTSKTHAATKPSTCLSLQLTEPNWESSWWKTSLPTRLSSRCRGQTLCLATASPSVPGRRWALEKQPQRRPRHLRMKVGPCDRP